MRMSQGLAFWCWWRERSSLRRPHVASVFTLSVSSGLRQGGLSRSIVGYQAVSTEGRLCNRGEVWFLSHSRPPCCLLVISIAGKFRCVKFLPGRLLSVSLPHPVNISDWYVGVQHCLVRFRVKSGGAGCNCKAGRLGEFMPVFVEALRGRSRARYGWRRSRRVDLPYDA